MRELSPLLLLIALVVPLGDAGATRSAVVEPCGAGGAIHSIRGAGESDPRGPDLMAPFALAASSPAEGAAGWTDAPRQQVTVLPRRAPAAEAPEPLASRPGGRRDALRRAAPDPALRAFPAHPSTAPPRIA